MRHLILLGLPQVGVATAFREFQHAVLTSLGTASGSMQLDLLADTMLVVVLGVVTLAANGVIAAFLIKRAATMDARCAPRDRRGGRRVDAGHQMGAGRRTAVVGPVGTAAPTARIHPREGHPIAVRLADSAPNEPHT